MIQFYACGDCGFLFRRLNPINECPCCEGKHIRPATEKEAAQLTQILQETASGACPEQPESADGQASL